MQRSTISWHHSEIKAWVSVRIRKQPMKHDVEWRFSIMAGLYMTGTSLVFVFMFLENRLSRSEFDK
jgi:hypothetical protein